MYWLLLRPACQSFISVSLVKLIPLFVYGYQLRWNVFISHQMQSNFLSRHPSNLGSGVTIELLKPVTIA
jgi:hypothetical protein